MTGWLAGHVGSTVHFSIPLLLHQSCLPSRPSKHKLQPVGKHAASDAISWALALKLVRVVNKHLRLGNCGYFPVQGNAHASWWGTRLAVTTEWDRMHINIHKCVIYCMKRKLILVR